MKPAYRKVTVSQLLSHTSAMPYQPATPETVTDARATTLAGKRYEYVKAAVQDEPEAPPGTKTIYSGGPVIVASYLERLMHQTWEELMKQTVWGPLEMKAAGVGSMATPGTVDGPWEHVVQDGKTVSIP